MKKGRRNKKPASGEASPAFAPDELQALTNRLLECFREPGMFSAGIPNLDFYRFDAPSEPGGYLLEPSICLILQGSKRVVLGEREYVYGANEFFITSVDLPVIAQIIEASAGKPYLGMVLKLDRMEIARLVMESPLPPARRTANHAIEIGEFSKPLLAAVARLVDLLDEPELIPLLSPLIQEEILIRLLMTDCGLKVRQLAVGGSPTHQISRAIEWIKGNLPDKLRVEDLAKRAGMSSSTFHHHFSSLTSLSPLQFQKRLRLNEARRLMLNDHLDAATAAFNVGYESPSQFSREYSRMFGAPPLRDMKHLAALVKGGISW